MLWIEEILRHLGWLNPYKNGINDLSTDAGILPSTHSMNLRRMADHLQSPLSKPGLFGMEKFRQLGLCKAGGSRWNVEDCASTTA